MFNEFIRSSVWGTPVARSRGVELGRAWPQTPWEQWSLELSGNAMRASHWVLSCFHDSKDGKKYAPRQSADDVIRGWLDKADWPARPIRVGLQVSDAAAEILLDAPGGIDIEWFRVPQDENEETVCRDRMLDALVHENADGGVVVYTLENEDSESQWYDWGRAVPLSFISLFPVRFDCSRITLDANSDGSPWLNPHSAVATRAIVEAAAVLARTPSRVNFEDELVGRRAIRPLVVEADRFEKYPAGRDPLQYVLKRLVSVIEHSNAGLVSVADRACARVASAFLATSAARIDDATRMRGLEIAARVSGNEPEVMLRLAAVRFSCVRDDAAIDALIRADRMLRTSPVHPGLDSLAFVLSELEHGPGSQLTLGRIAAGIVLASAGRALSELLYVRDEIADDMRYSNWLNGREQDQLLLVEVFRRLEQTRRAEQFALPMRRAA